MKVPGLISQLELTEQNPPRSVENAAKSTLSLWITARNSGKGLVCMREKNRKYILMERHEKPFFPSSLRCSWWGFLIVSKRYLSPNMPFCTNATRSICDMSAVSPEIALTGLTRSSGFLWDLLSCTDTDKSPHKSGPQIPWPLIKVIRPWSAISNHR